MDHPVLRGERVVIRPIMADDRGRLREILAEPDVARWWGTTDSGRLVEELNTDLIEERGHHRLTIDPAASNAQAIAAYASVGFKPVGLMRRYERGPDGTWHDGLLMDLLADEL